MCTNQLGVLNYHFFLSKSVQIIRVYKLLQILRYFCNWLQKQTSWLERGLLSLVPRPCGRREKWPWYPLFAHVWKISEIFRKKVAWYPLFAHMWTILEIFRKLVRLWTNYTWLLCREITKLDVWFVAWQLCLCGDGFHYLLSLSYRDTIKAPKASNLINHQWHKAWTRQGLQSSPIPPSLLEVENKQQSRPNTTKSKLERFTKVVTFTCPVCGISLRQTCCGAIW